MNLGHWLLSPLSLIKSCWVYLRTTRQRHARNEGRKPWWDIPMEAEGHVISASSDPPGIVHRPQWGQPRLLVIVYGSCDSEFVFKLGKGGFTWHCFPITLDISFIYVKYPPTKMRILLFYCNYSLEKTISMRGFQIPSRELEEELTFINCLFHARWSAGVMQRG